MTTNAMLGFGTLFRNGNGATPEVFTVVAEITNLTPPAPSRDSVDATHEQSPGGWREFIPGLADGGEVSFEINYDPGSADAAAFLAEFNAQGSAAVKNRQVLFPDGSYWQFAAFLTGLESEAPIDDKLAATVTLKVTGQPLLIQA
jgi:predicted secreted protein